MHGDTKLDRISVDTVLDDCFQLISLAFMTIGKNFETPAMYVLECDLCEHN
jgi:hypothetical protein